jgi:hypothetical protein
MKKAFLVFILAAGLLRLPVSASGVEWAGPIGAVESFGMFSINGQARSGNEPIWGGELLQAINGPVLVSVSGVGQVALRGASLRLARRIESDGSPLLVILLLGGSISVKLDGRARAYVQACESAMMASRGASFAINLKGCSAEVEALSGEVERLEQVAQRRYVLRPIGFDRKLSVRARSTRQIQIRVTDERDRPVPDLPIIFAISRGVGTFTSGTTTGISVTATTNPQGIATVTFTAGPNADAASFSATVEGTRYSYVGEIEVTAAAGFWTFRNSLLVIGAAAGAATAIVVATRGGREPIKPVGPPTIRP